MTKRKPSSEIIVRYRNDRAALLAQIDRLGARLAALEHENGELRAVIDGVRIILTPGELARIQPVSTIAPQPVPVSDPPPSSLFGHG